MAEAGKNRDGEGENTDARDPDAEGVSSILVSVKLEPSDALLQSDNQTTSTNDSSTKNLRPAFSVPGMKNWEKDALSKFTVEESKVEVKGQEEGAELVEDVLRSVVMSLGGGEKEEGRGTDSSEIALLPTRTVDQETICEEYRAHLRGSKRKRIQPSRKLVIKLTNRDVGKGNTSTRSQAKKLVTEARRCSFDEGNEKPQMSVGSEGRAKGGEGYKCQQCDEVFDTLTDIRDHRRLHQDPKPDEPSACKICGLDFKWPKELKKHMKTHKPKPYFMCKYCNKEFNKQDNLKVHLRIHTGEKPFHCEQCNKAFSRRPDLNRHRRVHTGEKPYVCDVCSQGFSQLGALKNHLILHTGNRQHMCAVCNKSFVQAYDLRIHERVHTGERPYECDLCQKSFTCNGTLLKHRRAHNDERPFMCETCTKRFRSRYGLKVHQRTHTGEKLYTCDVCGKQFSQSGDMNVHMRSHTGEKPYKCSVCDRCFASQKRLTVHFRTHTGLRPYTCEECNKTFVQSAHLKAHMRTHTGERPYKCEVCGQSFTSNDIMKKHAARTHWDAADKVAMQASNVQSQPGDSSSSCTLHPVPTSSSVQPFPVFPIPTAVPMNNKAKCEAMPPVSGLVMHRESLLAKATEASFSSQPSTQSPVT